MSLTGGEEVGDGHGRGEVQGEAAGVLTDGERRMEVGAVVGMWKGK